VISGSRIVLAQSAMRLAILFVHAAAPAHGAPGLAARIAHTAPPNDTNLISDGRLATLRYKHAVIGLRGR
jgi:hypothetical protein